MSRIKALSLAAACTLFLWGCEDMTDYDTSPYDPHDGAIYVPDDESMYQVMYDFFSEIRFYDNINIYGCADSHKVFDMTERIIAEHPELFWLDVSGVGSSPQHDVVDFGYHCIDFNCSEAEVRKMCDEVSEAADRVIKDIPEDASDWEKILFVHDAIIKTTWYQEGDEDYFTNTVYGCLVRHKTQCTGYSQAFQYIMERLGFECGVFSNDHHKWNYIRLDGEYYWIDLTYDDIVWNDGDDNACNYLHYYFMCDDEHFSMDHDLSQGKNYFVPQCNSFDKYYYFVDGSYFTEYDPAAIAEVIRKHNTENQVEIMFEDSRTFHEAIDKMNEGIGINEMIYAQNEKNELSYCWFDDMRILKIVLLP